MKFSGPFFTTERIVRLLSNVRDCLLSLGNVNEHVKDIF
jgi:hypothetical protein